MICIDINAARLLEPTPLNLPDRCSPKSNDFPSLNARDNEPMLLEAVFQYTVVNEFYTFGHITDKCRIARWLVCQLGC